MQSLGIQLPAPPVPFGTYVEAVQAGDLLFLSGMLPVVDHKPKYLGSVGKELDLEAGRDAARTAALSGLAAAREHLGSLDRISRSRSLGRADSNIRRFLRACQGCRWRLGSAARHLRQRKSACSIGDWRGQPSAGNANRARGHLQGESI